MIIIKGFNDNLKECKVCGCVEPLDRMTHIDKYGYLCSSCVDSCQDYGDENTVEVGKKGKYTLTYSIEFETSVREVELNELRRIGYIPTHDGSIEGFEWKSPIYIGRYAFPSHLQILDRYDYTVGQGCGTHLHVGTLSQNEKDYIRHYFNELFDALSNYLYGSRYTSRFWGRNFTGYAEKNISTGSRYGWVNIRTSQPTIEFRLPKFKSKTQYDRVIRFCSEVVKLLKKEAHKWNTGNYTYSKAEEVGNKILNIYEKYEMEVM